MLLPVQTSGHIRVSGWCGWCSTCTFKLFRAVSVWNQYISLLFFYYFLSNPLYLWQRRKCWKLKWPWLIRQSKCGEILPEAGRADLCFYRGRSLSQVPEAETLCECAFFLAQMKQRAQILEFWCLPVLCILSEFTCLGCSRKKWSLMFWVRIMAVFCCL